MNYLRPELLDKLAAEYVLGTLRGLARKRFERILAEHAVARVHQREWEERLGSLALAVPEVEPPPRLWRAIEARLKAEARRPPVPRRGFGWWREFALGMSALAAALLIFVGTRPEVAVEPGRSYVVVLSGDNLKPVMLAELDPRSGAIQVRVLARQDIARSQSLELWGLPREGKPRSYGLVPTSGVVRLPARGSVDKMLADIAALAISLEPRGGSPTGQPTGPILYKGELLRPL